jgi:hypothetical protein
MSLLLEITATLAEEILVGSVARGCHTGGRSIASVVQPGCGRTHRTQWERILHTEICR